MRVATLACVAGLLVAACSTVQVPRYPVLNSIKGSGSMNLLQMIDASNGWAYGSRRLARTGDGAQTFVDVTPPGVGADRVLRSHAFLDAKRAWVLVGLIATNARETLQATSDGGATWTSMTTLAPESNGVMTFVDSSHGWLIGGNWIPDCLASSSTCRSPTARQTRLERTSDGGATWSVVYQAVQHVTSDPLLTVSLPGGMGLSMVAPSDCGWEGMPRFLSAQVGFVGLSCPGAVRPLMAATMDGGHTWRQVTLPAPPGEPGTVILTSVERVHFFSSREGVAFISRCTGDSATCSPSGAMVHTRDGGLTWSVGAAVHSLGLDMEAVDGNHAWLSDGWLTDPATPSLLATSDAGATWNAYKLPSYLLPPVGGTRALQLVTPSLGFAVTWSAPAPEPTFYRTEDGGHTFESFTPQLPLG
jgi:hypothetical protein